MLRAIWGPAASRAVAGGRRRRRRPKSKRCSYEKPGTQRLAGHPHPQRHEPRRGESPAEVPRAASLELKKSLCRKVRDAAQERAEEMQQKIAELDDEQARLLAASPPAGEAGSQRPQGFALKY